MVAYAEFLEPKSGDLREHFPLVGNAGRKHPIKGAQPVGADQEQIFAQVVNISNFSPPHRNSGQRRFADNSGHFLVNVVGMI